MTKSPKKTRLRRKVFFVISLLTLIIATWFGFRYYAQIKLKNHLGVLKEIFDEKFAPSLRGKFAIKEVELINNFFQSNIHITLIVSNNTDLNSTNLPKPSHKTNPQDRIIQINLPVEFGPFVWHEDALISGWYQIDLSSLLSEQALVQNTSPNLLQQFLKQFLKPFTQQHPNWLHLNYQETFNHSTVLSLSHTAINEQNKLWEINLPANKSAIECQWQEHQQTDSNQLYKKNLNKCFWHLNYPSIVVKSTQPSIPFSLTIKQLDLQGDFDSTRMNLDQFELFDVDGDMHHLNKLNFSFNTTTPQQKQIDLTINHIDSKLHNPTNEKPYSVFELNQLHANWQFPIINQTWFGLKHQADIGIEKIVVQDVNDDHTSIDLNKVRIIQNFQSQPKSDDYKIQFNAQVQLYEQNNHSQASQKSIDVGGKAAFSHIDTQALTSILQSLDPQKPLDHLLDQALPGMQLLNQHPSIDMSITAHQGSEKMLDAVLKLDTARFNLNQSFTLENPMQYIDFSTKFRMHQQWLAPLLGVETLATLKQYQQIQQLGNFYEYQLGFSEGKLQMNGHQYPLSFPLH